jgi:hypothetical protein
VKTRVLETSFPKPDPAQVEDLKVESSRCLP